MSSVGVTTRTPFIDNRTLFYKENLADRDSKDNGDTGTEGDSEVAFERFPLVSG